MNLAGRSDQLDFHDDWLTELGRSMTHLVVLHMPVKFWKSNGV